MRYRLVRLHWKSLRWLLMVVWMNGISFSTRVNRLASCTSSLFGIRLCLRQQLWLMLLRCLEWPCLVSRYLCNNRCHTRSRHHLQRWVTHRSLWCKYNRNNHSSTSSLHLCLVCRIMPTWPWICLASQCRDSNQFTIPHLKASNSSIPNSTNHKFLALLHQAFQDKYHRCMAFLPLAIPNSSHTQVNRCHQAECTHPNRSCDSC